MMNLKKSILFSLLTIGFAVVAKAQDGKEIFESKCSVCHILGKDATGPNLIGIKAKWEGEEDNLYKWVLNPQELVESGTSERAIEAEKFSVAFMTPQPISLEEAKAVIDYVDTYVVPAPTPTQGTDPLESTGSDTSEREEVIYVDNYEHNLTIFKIFIFIILVLLLAIYVISRSTSALISSLMYRKKIAELHNKSKKNGKALSILLVIGFIGTSQIASALSFTGPTAAAKELELWAYVTSADINALLIITLLLLTFLLHMVNMFYKSLRLIKPKVVKVNAEGKPQTNSFTQALTGATPVEEEYKVDMGHDYDGIRELDNPMPPWWVALFVVTIIFGVVYVFHYHILGTGDLQQAEYERSMANAKIEVAAYRKANAMNVDETNATLMEDNADLMAGKALFQNKCALCHTEDGRGEIGPNLTDNAWIYGGDIKDVYKVIKLGAPKGMPAHESTFNPIQIQQVASYVLHFEEVSAADGGKAPEGKLVE
ncbi:cbb3-type cytochrome c oxidase N-terminal domain-containing protein [Brumimicrobium mesophilum]|uniref:cbb3-type cytochrome c oxidase N-terminal domain-containing protein n=1 Tax=Brumimicrobium mesophilum TaxID=392717 RepID=UPI00131B0837|nr:cbb3-type cytochrome c oxidase N-terminal domain-containing protein [Brumimicrobium mesophilum]